MDKTTTTTKPDPENLSQKYKRFYGEDIHEPTDDDIIDTMIKILLGSVVLGFVAVSIFFPFL